VAVARSKHFKGPYERYEGNPILYNGGEAFTAVGHGTPVIVPDGRMFYMCHSYLKGAGFFAGRQPIIQEMYVGDDNWVHIRSGRVAKIEQPMPFAKTKQLPVQDFTDPFNGKKLRTEWNWNYLFANVKTVIEKGELRLSGSPRGDNHYGSVLCLRADAPHYSYETAVVNRNHSMKGLTMYGDNENLVALATCDNKLILKTVKDGKEAVICEGTLTQGTAYLKIEVEEGKLLDFYKSDNGKQWTKINDNSIDSGYLVRWNQVARPGLIHIGSEDQPARFSYFRLKHI
jgi:beta-xylosidase